MRLPINKEEEEMLSKFPVGSLVKIYDSRFPNRFWVPAYLKENPAIKQYLERTDLNPATGRLLGLVIEGWSGVPVSSTNDFIQIEDKIDDRGQFRVVLVNEQVVIIHSYFLHEIKHV